MSMEEAFAPIEAYNKAVVMSDTWGHLYPEQQTKYYGYILFCYSEYGDITPIRVDFKDLPGSPWFFDDMIDYISYKCCHGGVDHLEEGHVYRFDGYYIKFKNGNCRFSGKIKKLSVK